METAENDAQAVNQIFNKRIERLQSFDRLVGLVASDLKELKYNATQYEAKQATFEKKILAAKTEILDLDEQIRRKKIEVAGSFNNLRDDLSRREQALFKAQAELAVSQAQVKVRADEAERLIGKAEKVIGKTAVAEVSEPAETPAEPEKRGPGRPRKDTVNA